MKYLWQWLKREELPSSTAFVIFFSLFVAFLIFSPGPIYTSFFSILAAVFLFWRTRSLSMSFLQIYLNLFFIGQPIFFLSERHIENFLYYSEKFVSVVPNPIFLKDVFFLFFLLSLCHPGRLWRSVQKLPLFLKVSMVLCFGLVLWTLSGQFWGNYAVMFTTDFFVLTKTFLLIPGVILFWYQLTDSSYSINLKKYGQQLFVSFIIFSLILQGLLASIQFVTQSPLALSLERSFSVKSVVTAETGTFRSAGTLGHPNFLGVTIAALLSFPILFLLYEISSSHEFSFKKNYLYISAFFLGLIALFLSFSRWSWLSFGVVLFFFLYQERNRVVPVLLQIWEKFFVYPLRKIIFLSAMSAVILIIIDRFRHITTWQGRVQALNHYAQLIYQSPWWGYGPGQSYHNLSLFRSQFEVYASALAAHNTFFLLGAEIGMVGLVLFIVFCAVLIWEIFKKNAYSTFFLVSLKIGLATLLLNMLVYPVYIFETSLELFFLLAGLYYLYGQDTQQTKRK